MIGYILPLIENHITSKARNNGDFYFDKREQKAKLRVFFLIFFLNSGNVKICIGATTTSLRGWQVKKTQ